MFPVGATVKNKLNNKIATVTEVLKSDGMIRVRFDGDTGTVPLHESRFETCSVVALDNAFGYVDPETFKKGDFVQVTDSDGVVFKGAALSDLDTIGYSTFELLTEDGRFLDFNANYVGIVVLFRADIARGQLPNY